MISGLIFIVMYKYVLQTVHWWCKR